MQEILPAAPFSAEHNNPPAMVIVPAFAIRGIRLGLDSSNSEIQVGKFVHYGEKMDGLF
jgi:hypothetical protein